MRKTVQDILNLIKANDIKIVDLKMVDINGQYLHVTSRRIRQIFQFIKRETYGAFQKAPCFSFYAE